MTTLSLEDFNLSPSIILGIEERRTLLVLALTDLDHRAEEADFLHHELDRAELVPDDKIPADVVRIGSMVQYRNTGGIERIVKVVLPADANDALNRVSVLSALGAALIGLRQGQSITWLDHTGRKRLLTVQRVFPTASDPGSPAA
ncbi:nucleoside diphosphate kinase regulator [Arsenicitalea aurantiaca]|uniref:Nucleoside diphosphate kinase regulator n=1 Tax=Arsenicitalea aurantiaca TaxID=1783274 RepID=A0A433X552_9HYPH|nr:GreA/GreB family elongation factor [Arsenicitalea aurantiaca]RUT29230.1 nucleoside diphosphate kinase regulator [Arsenicitalea aurantiaca]